MTLLDIQTLFDLFKLLGYVFGLIVCAFFLAACRP
jgi:hypothetical protein